MQDGQNLFFPEEAFRGQDWEVDETSQVLRAMRAVEDLIIVGVYSGEQRNDEYTKPGYEAYAKSLVEEIVPAEKLLLRATKDRLDRTMWGSSLGGVVSFYSVWQYPEVFGGAICMSSTFSHKDDLLDRVLSEPKREVGFYLDSGWPGDNYEVTIAMALALITRGWRYGHDLLTFVSRKRLTTKRPGVRGYIYRCNSLPASSHGPRSAPNESAAEHRCSELLRPGQVSLPQSGLSPRARSDALATPRGSA